MTHQQKHNIDTIAPTLATAGVGYLLYRRGGGKLSWPMTVFLLLIVFAVVYVISTRITKSAVNASLDVALPADGSGCTSFNPAPVCLAIHNEMDSYSGYDSAPYEALSALSDCQFVKAYNQWNHDYPGKTLRAVLNSYSPWLSMSYNSAMLPTLNQRFTRLNMV